jgi:Tol biopolymer transport system component
MALEDRHAQKPAGTHYSAAFVKDGRLIVFPFDGNESSVELPATPGAVTFSADGRTIYGVVSPQAGVAARLVAVGIKPSVVGSLVGSGGFSSVNGVAVSASGGNMIISGRYENGGAQVCGLYDLDINTGRVERVVENVGGGCDFLSSWSNLSMSPDGSRVVGTVKKGEVGIVNLSEHRIERVWPGTAASYSPDGRWIAAISFATPMEIELINASDLSKQRGLGNDDTGRLQWSPDSRYLLVWKADASCGVGPAYFGTLQALDVETGQRAPISSSKCRVNLMTTGWVNDEVLK